MSYLRQERRKHNHLESRVAAVETSIDRLQEDIVDVKTAVDKGFSKLQTQLIDDSKPNVAAVAAWATVVLIVIGMFGSLYIRDMSRIEEDTSSNSRDILAIQKELPEYRTLRKDLQREIDQKYKDVTDDLKYYRDNVK